MYGLGTIEWASVGFEVAPTEVRLKTRPFRSCAEIKQRVAKRYRVTVADLEGPSRKRCHARPRQIAMALAYRKLKPFGYSLPMIARQFGGRDHTTILFACRKFRKGAAKHGPAGPYHTQRRALEARASA